MFERFIYHELYSELFAALKKKDFQVCPYKAENLLNPENFADFIVKSFRAGRGNPISSSKWIIEQINISPNNSNRLKIYVSELDKFKEVEQFNTYLLKAYNEARGLQDINGQKNRHEELPSTKGIIDQFVNDYTTAIRLQQANEKTSHQTH